MPSKLAALLAALVLALALAVAGCGGSDESPEDVTESFYSALADEDAGEVCDLLSESAAESAAGGGDSCEDGFKDALETGAAQAALGLADDIEVGDSEIDGDSATVTVTSGDQEDEVPLVKEDGEWKVDIG
jgi:ABC-type glycerol-3-phosphate transport system substrate-binding protein